MNMQSVDESISGITLSEVAEQYLSRGLDTWSDARLIGSAAHVVAQPRVGPSDSFVLHAPLELGARAALLPLVAPDKRHLARLHIVALVAQYEGYERAEFASASTTPLPTKSDPTAWFTDSLLAGDLDEVDRAAVALAAGTTPHELASALADLIIPLTGAAAHGPIFLHQLMRLSPVSGFRADLLRPLARQLARSPQRRIHWVDHWDGPRPGADGHGLAETLATTPLLGSPGSSFIDPLISQVDASADVTDGLAAVLGPAGADQARAVIRTAARSMLLDTADHAPYGWTHCLTMPQAVLGIASLSSDPDRALAVASTHVAAFRAGLGQTLLATADRVDSQSESKSESEPESSSDPSRSPTALATEAATSHDAHIAKYVLACLDASKWDRDAADLYLRSARRLLDVWEQQGGDPTDPLAEAAA